ncbi:hypothetical protein HYV82_04915 [Candidatus Woesearchaeota archaeon]|nr:hypothetical protein [Candidatus Woesearchaeota archaeon]
MQIPIVKDLASLAYRDIHRRRKTAPFIILVTFVVSFALARLTVLSLPDFAIVVRQYHIHHFYYGIALISAAAWIALVSNKPRLITLAAVFFGAGLGLVADEIGLLLTCNSEGLDCNYYARGSFDLAVLLGLSFLAFIYFPPFWRKVKSRVARALRRIKAK